jgi:hypothetical protein
MLGEMEKNAPLRDTGTPSTSDKLGDMLNTGKVKTKSRTGPLRRTSSLRSEDAPHLEVFAQSRKTIVSLYTFESPYGSGGSFTSPK